MAYKQREVRRIEIIDATLRIASQEGFGAATVRRIGTELAIAASNIHHVFASSGEMKREAFEFFASREHERIFSKAEGHDPIEDLNLLLFMSDPDGTSESMSIWNEASQEAARDPEFAEAFGRAIKVWHDRIVDILRSQATGSSSQAIEASAWRLMGAAVGLSGFARTAHLGIDEQDAASIVHSMVHDELALLRIRAT